jgi:predicted Zn-dependent protease
LFLETYTQAENQNFNSQVVEPMDSIINHIAKANAFDREYIKVHIIEKDEINAFALPYGHLIINSGLILNCDNQEELIGVICHEIAHIELDHVMKKLVKEIGLSVLISMASGNSGGDVIKESLRVLSSSAFDRSLEKEADLKAVDYLVKAKVDPEPFAEFLYKISKLESDATQYFNWVSTHPASKERATYIIEYHDNELSDYQSILTTETWESLKAELAKSSNHLVN